MQAKQNERQQQTASSAPPTTKQEDEDKDKIIADLKNRERDIKETSQGGTRYLQWLSKHGNV